MEENEKLKPGYVLMPYIIKEHTEESEAEYDAFMTEYKKKHAVCPKCGAIPHSSTLMGYILNSDKKEEYKDLNNCTCLNCEYQCTAHERISEEEFENK